MNKDNKDNNKEEDKKIKIKIDYTKIIHNHLFNKFQNEVYLNKKNNVYHIFVLSVLINSSITFSNIVNGNAPFNKTAKMK